MNNLDTSKTAKIAQKSKKYLKHMYFLNSIIYKFQIVSDFLCCFIRK